MATRLPSVAFSNIFPPPERVDVTVPKRTGFGELPLKEKIILAMICRTLEPRTVLEIGTYRGSTALTLAMNTPEEAEIYTLDLPLFKRVLGIGFLNYAMLDRVLPRFLRYPFRVGEKCDSSKLVQLYGDSLTFDFSRFYSRMDLVFIDGNHDYYYVRSDTENAFRMVSERGVILWDDYGETTGLEVMRALGERQEPIVQVQGTQLAVYISGRTRAARDLSPGARD